MAKTSSSGNAAALYMKRLKKLKEAWDGAKEDSSKSSSFQIEDGKKKGKLSNMEIRTNTQNKDWLHVFCEFTIVEGDETGKHAYIRWGLETDENLVHLQRNLRKLGVEVDDMDPEELPDIVETLLKQKPTCKLTVKTNGDYQNVYIDKLLNDDDEGGDEGSEPEVDEDEDDDNPRVRPGKAGKKKDEDKEPGEDDEKEDEKEDEEETVDKGAEVAFKLNGKKTTGLVIRSNPSKKTCVVRPKGKSTEEFLDWDDVAVLAAASSEDD